MGVGIANGFCSSVSALFSLSLEVVSGISTTFTGLMPAFSMARNFLLSRVLEAPLTAKLETEKNAGISLLTIRTAAKATKERSYKQLSDLKEMHSFSVGPFIDKDVAGYKGRCLTDKVGIMFDLFKDLYLNPAFSDEEFYREKSLIMKGIE